MDPQDAPPKTQVSSRSKKEDILSAYEELLKKMQDNAEHSGSRKIDVERKREDSTLEKASGLSPDSLLKNVSHLEGEVRKWLGDLVELLIKELQKLQNVQEALHIEKQHLEEIHAIKAEADTLAKLIQAHKEKKSALETEYQDLESELEKQIEAKKEAWKREQEEYQYELQMRRRKEEAAYEEKKMIREKAIHDRETKLMAQEKELEELRKLKELFDERIAEEVEEARSKAMDEVVKEEIMKARIIAEKVAAEKRIADMSIESLKQKITEQGQDITRLKQQLEAANSGVKDIALKVIEGNSVRATDQHRSIKEYENEKNLREGKVVRT